MKLEIKFLKYYASIHCIWLSKWNTYDFIFDGMENILIPQFNPDKFDKLLIKYHPTHILGVPTHYAKLFESKRLKNKDLSFLKIVGVGGDSLSVEMEKRIEEYLHMHGANITVATGYGMTEVSAAACGFHKMHIKWGA